MKNIVNLLRTHVLYSMILLFMGFQTLEAQQTISGLVVDTSGVGIPGANVVVQGTSTGAVTDFDGNFNIAASSGDVLEVSFIGYVTQSISITNQSSLRVVLEEDAENLEEVVVIGYGTARKSDLTGAVSKVTSESFDRQPLNRVEDALNGRAAGVTVARAGGGPGAAVKVRIRGVNSINGNNSPLVVIDGIIGGDLSTINPNDIESMDVLKDASATAIYGSRGSNGVIIVTTKKGSGKPRIDVDYFTTVSDVPKYLPSLNGADFARIENGRRVRMGGTPIFSQTEIDTYELTGGTDYQREIFQTGLSQNAQLSVSGSEGKTNYFLSANYVDQEGIVLNTGYERYSLRSNIDISLNDRLKVGLNAFATRAKILNDLTVMNRYQGSLVTKATAWDPTTPIFDANGNYNRFSTQSLASLAANPVEDLNTTNIQGINDRLNINFNISFDITDNLNYTFLAGVSTINNNTETYRLDHPLNDVAFASTNNTNHQVSSILTWQKIFDDVHNVKVTGVHEFSGSEGRFNNYGANDLSIPLGFYFAELSAAQNISNGYGKSAIESVMGRVEYIYNNNLFVTGTLRADSSSKFREGNRTGYFPSVSARYRFDDLLENGGFINSLSLRGGWGQVGNQNIANYSTFPSVAVTGQGRYAFDGSTVSAGSAPGSYGNPDLTWETTTQSNIGIDLGLLDNRLNITVDAYVKNTEDLLLDVPVPTTNGGGFIRQNIGEVENKGLDISFSGTIIETDDLSWSSSFNLSYSKNKVVSLGGEDEIQGTFGSIDGTSKTWNRIIKGDPIGQFWGATFLGTWKSTDNIPLNDAGNPIAMPGDARYAMDADNNMTFGVIGNGTPTTSWGFNNTITFKNWDVNVLFQGMAGFEVLNAVKGVMVGNTGNSRSFMHQEQLNQWTSTNETDIPAGGINEIGSTRYVEKGDFIRLSNLSVGYTFEDVKYGLDYVKLYASGQNLLLITDYTGYDPEHTSRPADNAGNVDVAAGINVGAYPNPRTFSVGVKVGL